MAVVDREAQFSQVFESLQKLIGEEDSSFAQIGIRLADLVKIYDARVDDIYQETCELLQFLAQRNFNKPKVVQKPNKKRARSKEEAPKDLPNSKKQGMMTPKSGSTFENVSLSLCTNLNLKKDSRVLLHKRSDIHSQEKPTLSLPLFEEREHFAGTSLKCIFWSNMEPLELSGAFGVLWHFEAL